MTTAPHHPSTAVSLLAVGALEHSERRRAEHHLRSCHRCRRTLDALHATLAELVGHHDPPADRVWSSIVARLVSPAR